TVQPALQLGYGGLHRHGVARRDDALRRDAIASLRCRVERPVPKPEVVAVLGSRGARAREREHEERDGGGVTNDGRSGANHLSTREQPVYLESSRATVTRVDKRGHSVSC